MRTLSRRLWIVLSLSLLFGFLPGYVVPTEAVSTGDRVWPRSAYERLGKAADHGEITLKEAVLSKTQLLFAPKTIAKDHPFGVQADEVPVAEECLTGFYKDVHKVFDELTEDEEVFLGSLSPDLSLIVTAREREKSEALGVSRVGALPDFGLDKEVEGKYCIIHYTLTGANASPDQTYADLVKKYMDMAIASKMTTHFKKAYVEGSADFQGKLHAYVLDMDGNGEWVDVSQVETRNKRAGYIKISTKIKDNFGTGWQLKMKGLCFHQYFHGIQSAYNALSDLWFLEATAVWASCTYGGVWTHLREYYHGRAPDPARRVFTDRYLLRLDRNDSGRVFYHRV